MLIMLAVGIYQLLRTTMYCSKFSLYEGLKATWCQPRYCSPVTYEDKAGEHVRG